MKHDRNIQSIVDQFWQSLENANEELNSFITSGMPSTTEKRHKPFVKKWNVMKEKAEMLCDQIEQSSLSVDPVEISLPWSSQEFSSHWQMWKDYLLEQHNRRMKSRMEYAALAQLKAISEDSEDKAIEYLQYAMAGGYQKFFKVTEKSYEQPTISGVKSDGDY
ncbi:hypothetical protein [Prevotella sp. P6B1]|uniref:hypothetical protein n=1 Tax=Prevotella sp. P6B1 TaxID=1410613 RepID=UPI00051B397D|nr:hypothetical protein [Prevotella sp. P6B1]